MKWGRSFADDMLDAMEYLTKTTVEQIRLANQHKRNEYRAWAKENGIKLWFKQGSRKIKLDSGIGQIWFHNKEDAMAFKLRWL